jgi:transcription elongation factor Elf1
MSDDDTFHFYLKRSDWPLTYEVGYCPGKKFYCPRCNSDKVSIFFKPGFLGIENGKWCDYMDEKKFELCDDYQIIKKSNYHPNWICKNCYNCGVILNLEKFQ